MPCPATAPPLPRLPHPPTLPAPAPAPTHPALPRRGAPLTAGDGATLAQCEIYPGEEIRVVDSGEHDASDLASLFPSYSGAGGKGELAGWLAGWLAG